MRLPRTFLGLWAFIAGGGLIAAAVTIGIVAGVSGGGMELVRQRAGSIGGIGAVVGLLFMAAVGALAVQSKRDHEERDRRGAHLPDASDP